MMNIRPVFEKLYPAGSYGGQCGTFAHKLVEFLPVGDLLRDKIAAVKKYGSPVTPKIASGDVLIQSGGIFGHVAIVNNIPLGGFIQLTESNFRLHEKVTHDRTVIYNDKSNIGFIKGKLKIKTGNHMDILKIKGESTLVVRNNEGKFYDIATSNEFYPIVARILGLRETGEYEEISRADVTARYGGKIVAGLSFVEK